MNKIKILYDVVTTMKKKEAIKGKFEAEAKKDGLVVFGMTNEFERNMTSGSMKAKLKTEYLNDGKSFKHESSTEFEGDACKGHHGFMKHMHMNHHHHLHKHHEQGGMRFSGPREGLNKITFVLGVFSSIKLEEMEDKAAILSLNIKDIPEELREAFKERMKEAHGHGEKLGMDNVEMKGHHAFMKEFHDINDPNAELKLWINKDREVERILILASGKSSEEESAKTMELRAELNLI